MPGIPRHDIATKPVSARIRPWALFSRGLRERRGVAMLEFVFAGPVLLVFTGAILEFGYLLFTQAILDNATADAVRIIRTGQLQIANGTASTFLAQVCNGAGGVINCGLLQTNIQSGTSFAALTGTVSVNEAGNLTPQGFSPGAAGQDVVVQVGYSRTFLFPWVGRLLSANGTGLLVSTAVFQNEQYD